jgi:hypothetical protein
MRWQLLVLTACGAAPSPPAPPRPPRPVVAPTAPVPTAIATPPDEPTSAIPMITSPCDDVTQDVVPELVADFDHPQQHEVPGAVAHPLLCWGADCVWDGEPVPRPTARKPTIEHQVSDKKPIGTSPVAIVNAGKVCTADRCDDLGPKLRAAIEATEGGEVRATSDREAVVIGREVWSRSKDTTIKMPAPRRDEGDVASIHVLGNRLAIGRGCNEYCADLGRIVDSRGRPVGTGSFLVGNPISSIPDPIDLAGDRFLLFSGFGDVTLVANGKPVDSTHVGVEGGRTGAAPVPARVIALALTSDVVALEVCTPIGCQLARLSVSEWSEGNGRSSTHLEYRVVRQLPRCSTAPPSY